MNTHGLIVDFGKWNGHLYTRVPVQYLKWMVQSGHSKAEIAKAELERRGTVTPELDVSGHAVDRASKILLKVWQNDSAVTEEGLHGWLCRVALEAYKSRKRNDHEYAIYRGIKWVFQLGEWPVLKTVMMQNKSNARLHFKSKDRDNFFNHDGAAAFQMANNP